jgi:phage protein U
VGEEQDGLLADGTPRKQGFDLEFRRYGDDYQNI